MEALKYAKTHWHSPFVAVMSTLDCDGDPHDPQNAFWHVSSVSFDDKTRTAKLIAEEIDIDDVFVDITLSWGKNAGLKDNDDSREETKKPSWPPGSDGGVIVNDSDNNETPGSNGGVIQHDSDDNDIKEPSWLPGSNGGVIINSDDASTNISTYPPSCGAAPAASIDGFPAADCGPGFDDALDSALGYLAFDDADFLQSLRAFLPGIIDVLTTNSSTSNDNSLAQRRRRALSHISAAHAHLRIPRGLPDSLVKIGVAAVQSKLADGALQAIQSAAAGQGVLAQAASWVEGALGWLQDALGSSSSSGSSRSRTQTIPISKDFSVNIGPRPAQLVDSGYWGRAYPILSSPNNATGDDGSPSSSVDLYCVDCRVRGNAHVAGQIQYTIGTRNLSIGRVSLGGSLEASLGLGLASAGGPYQGSVYKTMASLPMNAFTIPNLLSIGPVLSLDANLTVDSVSGGVGQVLFGAKASIPNYGVSFDLLRNSDLQGNFAPVLTTNFRTNGTVNTEARLGVPLKMSLKIEVPAVKWNKSISVVNEPYLLGSVTDASDNCTDSAAYSVQVGNKAHVEVLGSRQFDLNTDRDLPPKAGCVQASNSTLSKRQDVANATETQQAADNSIPFSLASESNNFGGDGILDGKEMTDLMDFTINKGKTDPTSKKPHDPGFAYSRIRHTNNSSAPWHLYASPSGTFSLLQRNTSQPHHRRATDDEDGNDPIPIPIDDGDDVGFYFGHAGGIACTDPAGRLMYFFPSTMAAHGVSRLRFATQYRIPHGANFVALAGGAVDTNHDGDEDTPTTPDGLMMAVDSLGNGFYPVACSLDGLANKVFLVKDLDDGVRKLEAEEMRHIVTGGVTSGCAPLALFLVKDSAAADVQP
ncbi:hypothetical protein DBV05_g10127 [Lasiodiplodia theobromae]|uniref:Uncharacterized protein n=1 Tax=Lasiodiplodia theobromae TaxID=45133 RepID=A0A5N5D0L3_9PEZI|nr:hypothetical protein DBV05_g10127 [Lasiodiplodia theobromae]